MASTLSEVTILESPVRSIELEQDVLTPAQWRTLLAIGDTVIPPIHPARSARHGQHYVVDDKEYDGAVEEILAGDERSSQRQVAERYLSESASSIPALVEAMRRQLILYTPQENLKQLSLVLTALGSKPLSVLLTGSSKPFAQHKLSERLAIYRSWATSYIPALRKLHKMFGCLFVKAWVLSSPTLPQVLGMPRVPVNYQPPAEDYPFRFLQIPPGQGPEILETDVVIVGSGCGGSVTAKNLAEAGHRVIVVEGAYHFSNKHFPMTTAEGNEHMFALNGANLSDDASTITMSGETWGGGGTINWAAALQTQGFVRQEWANEGLALFTSAEYQAAMDRAWKHMGCSVDPVQHNHQNRVTLEGARKLGYAAKPVAANSGGKLHDDGYTATGCASGIKQSPTVLWLPEAAQAGAHFIEGLRIDRVVFEDSSRTVARGVRGRWRSRDANNGVAGIPVIEREVEIRARRVIISGGSLRSPIVLLNSGLKNSNIGRHLHLHPGLQSLTLCAFTDPQSVATVSAVFPYRTNPWEGSMLTSVCNEFENLDGRGHGAKIENMIQMPGVFLPILSADEPLNRKRTSSNMKNGAGFIALCRDRDGGRVYPDPNDGRTRVEYTPSLFDRKHIFEAVLGIAKMAYMCGAIEIQTCCADIPPFRRAETNVYSTEPLNRENGPAAACQGQGVNDPDFQSWLQRVKATANRSGGPLNPERTLFGSAHQMGSCRMGVSPKKSVVDPTGQVWGVKGLYVADASVMPSASGVNPMMTTYAIADIISRGIANGLVKEGRSRL
ncbi:hypothetical protein KEM52_005585 [Ascosphaera acerosa]|nr:hypothetical protein KEM52_005585 [Ascosphaera acerosa]